MLGSFLLISVVIAAVAIVGVILMSQTTPQEIPNVNFMTGSDTNNNLYLSHNGGDSLAKGSFYVLVDGTRRDDYSISDGSNTWSLGKNLILGNVPSTSFHYVAVIYNQSGGNIGPVVLRSVNTSNLAIINNTISPDVIASSAYPPIISVPQLMQNVTNKSVSYYRDGGTRAYGYIQFNVTKSGSNITYEADGSSALTTITVAAGQKVTVYQNPVPTIGMHMTGIGDQILELSTDHYHVLNITAPGGLVVLANTSCAINQSFITGYKNFTSTMTLSGDGTSQYMMVMMNNDTSSTAANQFQNTIINSVSPKSVTVYNITPARVGIFSLQADNATRMIFFYGDASRVTIV